MRSFLRARLTLMKSNPQKAVFVDGLYIYEEDRIIQKIALRTQRCGCCGSFDVTVIFSRPRRIQASPCGRKKFYLELDVHILYCLSCKKREVEELKFLSHPKARITSLLERTIIELRGHMCISAIAKYYDLDWRLVKDTEKRHLEKKYRNIRLRDVRVIGIDELFVTRKKGVEKYITVVRDLESGAVLFVGKGKGGGHVGEFRTKIETFQMQDRERRHGHVQGIYLMGGKYVA